MTSWVTAKGGGIPPVIRALQREQLKQGWAVRVAGIADPSATSGTAGAGDITGRIIGPSAFGYSPGLKTALSALRPAIVHVHGLWMYPGWLARQSAVRSGALRLVSPHGMLEPWALRNSPWKKRIAAAAFERRNLQSAACLHALCRPEADNIRAYGLQNPIAIIPNGVDLSAYENSADRSRLEERFPKLKGRRWILFLSRIHPKKGLPHLLHAWKQTLHAQPAIRDWLLVIAGPDELGHEAEIKQLCAELSLPWTDSGTRPVVGGQMPAGGNVAADYPPLPAVLFTGPLHGEEKRVAFAHAEIFALPSFSEGFSMAVLEAAAAGLPVLLTPQCNFPELVVAGGAIEVEPNALSCAEGLHKLLALPEAERRGMGQRGRELVARNYTWTRVAQQMLAVYRWLLHGGEKPGCVHGERLAR